MKCIECGTELNESVKICPNCGCPVSETAEEQNQPTKERVAKTLKINWMAVVSLILGIVVLIMGFKVSSKKYEMEEYSAKTFSVDYAAFGGDFYTEIYNASDVAVDAISAVNGGIAALSSSVADLAEVMTYCAGMVIVALGIGVIAISALHIRKEG